MKIKIGANITVPAIYDKALTLYIVAQALYRDRQTARAGQYEAKYMQELARFRSDMTEIINMQPVDTGR